MLFQAGFASLFLPWGSLPAAVTAVVAVAALLTVIITVISVRSVIALVAVVMTIIMTVIILYVSCKGTGSKSQSQQRKNNKRFHDRHTPFFTYNSKIYVLLCQ